MASLLSSIKSKAKTRKRKAKKAKMEKHMSKHPDYYNQELVNSYRVCSLIIIFYLLLLSLGGKSERS